MDGSDRRRRHGRRCRVLLYPLPFQGHINPMFHLAAVLHSRGFAVTILHTTFHAPDPALHPSYRFVPVDFDHDGLRDQLAAGDFIGMILSMSRRCVEPLRERLFEILSESRRAGEEQVACMVADMHWHSTPAMGTEMGLPVLMLRTGSAFSFTLFAAYAGLGQLQPDSEENPADKLPAIRVKDMLRLHASNDGDAEELMARNFSGARAAAGVLVNTFEAIERAELEMLRSQVLDRPVFAVGPLHKQSSSSSHSISLLTEDGECLQWLDTQAQASVLYVSVGSLASMDPEQFAEMAWGIANSGRPFLWVVRPGSVLGQNGAKLPEGFTETVADRGKIVSWAPQQEVLGHEAVGGFWTHNGWNSTLEALSEGIPMLCMPHFGDQMENARYVCHIWGVGVRLPDRLEQGEVERCIRRLMEEKDGDEIREKARQLKLEAAKSIADGGTTHRDLDKLEDYFFSFP